MLDTHMAVVGSDYSRKEDVYDSVVGVADPSSANF